MATPKNLVYTPVTAQICNFLHKRCLCTVFQVLEVQRSKSRSTDSEKPWLRVHRVLVDPTIYNRSRACRNRRFGVVNIGVPFRSPGERGENIVGRTGFGVPRDDYTFSLCTLTEFFVVIPFQKPALVAGLWQSTALARCSCTVSPRTSVGVSRRIQCVRELYMRLG